MDLKKLGQKIQSLRKSAGFTQRALAADSGVAYATIQDLEKGMGNPTVATLEALAKKLGEPLIGLYNLEDGGRIPAEHLTDSALAGLNQLKEADRNRKAAQSERAKLGNKGVRHGALALAKDDIDSIATLLGTFSRMDVDQRASLINLAATLLEGGKALLPKKKRSV